MVEPVTMAEPEGLYAVVRSWEPPWSHEAGPAEPAIYVKAPSVWGDVVYWYRPGSEDGWAWDQVVRRSVRVEIVRDGMPS